MHTTSECKKNTVQRIKDKAFITLFLIFIYFSCGVLGYVVFWVTVRCWNGIPDVTWGLSILLFL